MDQINIGGNMSWEHFDAIAQGNVTITDLEGTFLSHTRYALGKVTTGRSRSFHCYRLVITHGTITYIGEDKYSMRRALMGCAEKLRADHFSITVVGLSDSFKETGLSSNTGYGYLPSNKKSVHMMDEMGSSTLEHPSTDNE